ncbi:MAG TPA: hypothetical protein VKD25_08765 [Burkholderiales bacterium]|nr:hypothetical protein [Burkholderiales bacterium]
MDDDIVRLRAEKIVRDIIEFAGNDTALADCLMRALADSLREAIEYAPDRSAHTLEELGARLRRRLDACHRARLTAHDSQ